MWEIVIFLLQIVLRFCAIVSLALHLPHKFLAEMLSQTHRVCFTLLHYHYVSTSLTMQIPSGNVLNMTNSK